MRKPDPGAKRPLLWRSLTGFAVLYATAVAVGTLFGVQTYPWADLFRGASVPYDISIGIPFEWIQARLHSLYIPVPTWVRDVLTIWIALGRLVRRSISEMSAQTDADYHKLAREKQPPSLREKVYAFLKEPRKSLRLWWQKPAVRESVRFTLFPLGRLWVDLRERRYWGLTPKMVGLNLVYALAGLGLFLVLDRTIGPMVFE